MFVSTEEHHENPVRPREKSFVPLHHLGRIIVIHLIRGFQGKKPAAQLDIHYILMNDRALLNPSHLHLRHPKRPAGLGRAAMTTLTLTQWWRECLSLQLNPQNTCSCSKNIYSEEFNHYFPLFSMSDVSIMSRC